MRFINPVFLVLLLFAVGCIGNAVIEPSYEDAKAYSKELACVLSEHLPDDWYIARTEVGPSPWFSGHNGIQIDLREKDALNAKRSFQASVVLIPRSYHPLRNGLDYCAPFPLIARIPRYQVFLWGAPSFFGWEFSVRDIAGALATIENEIEWNDLSDQELERLEHLRGTGDIDSLVVEWESHVNRLKSAGL